MNDERADLHDFETIAKRTFGFLRKDFGALGPEVEQPDAYTLSATYQTASTAFRVQLELRENDIYAFLVRKVDGEIPPYFRNADDWAYLDTLMRKHGVEVILKPRGRRLTSADVSSRLRGYSSALSRLGDEILRGDFSEFPTIAASNWVPGCRP